MQCDKNMIYIQTSSKLNTYIYAYKDFQLEQQTKGKKSKIKAHKKYQNKNKQKIICV